MPGLQYTVTGNDSGGLNSIVRRYGFNDYQSAGVSSVPSGNFDLIHPGDVINIGNYNQPPAQPPTPPGGTDGPMPPPAPGVNSLINGAQTEEMAAHDAVPTKDGVSGFIDTYKDVREALKSGMPQQVDYLKQYGDLKTQYGLPALETKLNDLNAEDEQLAADFRAQKTSERGKPVAMNVIDGRIGEEERTYREHADYVGRQKSVLQGQMKTAYDTIDNIMKYSEKSYDDAKSAYDSEFSHAISAMTLLNKNENEDQTHNKAALQVYYNSIMTGGLDPRKITPQMESTIRQLELKNGLDAGTFKSLQARNPKARITGISTDANGLTSFMMQDDSTGVPYVQTAQKSSGPTANGPVFTAKQIAGLKAKTAGRLENTTKNAEGYSVKGTDKYTDPYVYLDAYNEWEKYAGRGLGGVNFLKAFPPKQYINPTGYKLLPKGIRPSAS